MRTHRLTLPVSQAEKSQIAQQAAALGISPGEYARKAATMLDAEDIAGLEEIRSLLPEFNAALDRIHHNLVAMAESSERTHQEIERLRSPEYREEVRRSIIEDRPALAAAARLFGTGQPEEASGEPEPRVKERREPWVSANPQDKKRKRRK
ncbi:MAG: plasmid mobilization protein [Allosphingosinicella sp.]